MDTKQMRKELQKRLEKGGRIFSYDREKDVLRVENGATHQGMNISLPEIVAKWNTQKEKAIDEVVYYAEEALNVMGKAHPLSGREKYIFPVIRSSSFPKEAREGVLFLTDEHTAETRIYYALDLGKTYRLIDLKLLEEEGWSGEHVRETARFNVRSLSTEMKKDTVAGNDFYFLNTNDGYDASRILNEKFLKEMAEKVKGEMVVAVPHQDVLIIGDIRNETGYDVMAQMTMNFFANGHVPITALSFLYKDGELEPIFIMGKKRKS
ncbi:DUF1444 domain-containing protein [Weizmannia acidilactici]|uniref:DUF1444 domain-containing protein n=1 Tax=Weizmannia acidilactici TaxID=2607726 RepID=UPI00124E2F97|nr:DUF1444 domain-containing protein [Weizmannia acidilactici]GER72267.1 UPF0354 protein [Weizmannia acidilactici]